MIDDAFIVQSLPVHILCEDELYPGVKSYFDSLSKTKDRPPLDPFSIVLKIQAPPSQLPADATFVVETAVTRCYRRHHQHYFLSKDGSLFWFDSASRCCHGFIRPEIRNDVSTICSLISGPLLESMRVAGRFYLHAAALSHNGVGYLVSGDGGSGKTTTALNLVKCGFDYVSDDSLLMDRYDGDIRVFAWYRDFHLSADMCQRYEELNVIMTDDLDEGEKVSIDVAQFFKGTQRDWIEPDVILFPQIVSQPESSLSPLTPMQTFMRLIKQILIGSDADSAAHQLETVRTLVQRTCGFELKAGRDLLEDPNKLRSIIAKLPVRH
jgi:hypothetical protein